MRKLFVFGHQGLGDHILCNGIYHELSKHDLKIFVFVKRRYQESVQRMTRNNPRIVVIPVPNWRFWSYLKVFCWLSELIKLKSVKLGTFGDNFLIQGTRFDHNFYLQCGVNFDARWDKFEFQRNLENEVILQNHYDIGEDPYIFLHEDKARGYEIDRNLLPKGIRIIEPLMENKGFQIFDYYQLLINAKEIHCIESSFAAFIESLQLRKVRLFAHRYARPNALYDFRYEYTYRLPWKILLNPEEKLHEDQ